MGKNILITGGAGYMGSLVAEFISRTTGPFKQATISASVQSEEQVQKLSKLGINVIQLDLSNEAAVEEAVLRDQIDIVVNTASSFDWPLVFHMIKALGQRRKASGEETFFIQSSVATVFSAEAGWPYGKVKDTDPVYEREKQIGGPHHVRETNVRTIEEAKAHGVTSFIVPVPTVYGRGTGECRKLSVSIPQYIRVSIKHKVVYKFDKDGNPPGAHISDLTALYALLVERILLGKPIPSGEKGYYFPMAHRVPWWDVMQRIAKGLYALGLVPDPEPQVWSSDEMAAEYLGFPIQYVRAMGTASPDLEPVNPYRLGWQPKWDEKRFLASIEDEILAVQELDTVSNTIFNTLLDSDK